MVCEAIKLLKADIGNDVAIGTYVLGPFTLAGQLMDLNDLFKLAFKKPKMVNEMLDEVSRPESASKAVIDLEQEEKIIWEGRPFLSLVENYTLTNERIKIITGLIGKDIQNYELIRVQDIDITQNVSERMLGIGDIVIKGADQSSPTIVLRNIHDPQEVYELLRKAWLAARKKYGLIFREEM